MDKTDTQEVRSCGLYGVTEIATAHARAMKELTAPRTVRAVTAQGEEIEAVLIVGECHQQEVRG